ncbi:hypothetical protein SGLAD_v1c06000 [Spiroplasma gladiatoris]|uniref:DUF2828 domain-containing protein n=1 Tax=Spiroplasma gladiatoris TaxID=2143 RepID=A0A4V1AQA3_9MOLU|nr:DUF2828 family protein [Spiroplasma gladiatoris]QBQ07799.1 hypothetical protein SGLAD_v1c06000 [Spiroplasma gladiatoris]
MRLIELIYSTLISEVNRSDKSISLISKWMPSINASSYKQITLAKKFVNLVKLNFDKNFDYKAYRKLLTSLRVKLNLFENNLRIKDYQSINYSNLSGKSLKKYANAFSRNDFDKYNDFINKSISDSNNLNANNFFAYEIIEHAFYDINEAAAYWINMKKIVVQKTQIFYQCVILVVLWKGCLYTIQWV